MSSNDPESSPKEFDLNVERSRLYKTAYDWQPLLIDEDVPYAATDGEFDKLIGTEDLLYCKSLTHDMHPSDLDYVVKAFVGTPLDESSAAMFKPFDGTTRLDRIVYNVSQHVYDVRRTSMLSLLDFSIGKLCDEKSNIMLEHHAAALVSGLDFMFQTKSLSRYFNQEQVEDGGNIWQPSAPTDFSRLFELSGKLFGKQSAESATIRASKSILRYTSPCAAGVLFFEGGSYLPRIRNQKGYFGCLNRHLPVNDPDLREVLSRNIITEFEAMKNTLLKSKSCEVQDFGFNQASAGRVIHPLRGVEACYTQRRIHRFKKHLNTNNHHILCERQRFHELNSMLYNNVYIGSITGAEPLKVTACERTPSGKEFKLSSMYEGVSGHTGQISACIRIQSWFRNRMVCSLLMAGTLALGSMAVTSRQGYSHWLNVDPQGYYRKFVFREQFGQYGKFALILRRAGIEFIIPDAYINSETRKLFLHFSRRYRMFGIGSASMVVDPVLASFGEFRSVQSCLDSHIRQLELLSNELAYRHRYAYEYDHRRSSMLKSLNGEELPIPYGRPREDVDYTAIPRSGSMAIRGICRDADLVQMDEDPMDNPENTTANLFAQNHAGGTEMYSSSKAPAHEPFAPTSVNSHWAVNLVESITATIMPRHDFNFAFTTGYSVVQRCFASTIKAISSVQTPTPPILAQFNGLLNRSEYIAHQLDYLLRLIASMRALLFQTFEEIAIERDDERRAEMIRCMLRFYHVPVNVELVTAPPTVDQMTEITPIIFWLIGPLFSNNGGFVNMHSANIMATMIQIAGTRQRMKYANVNVDGLHSVVSKMNMGLSPAPEFCFFVDGKKYSVSSESVVESLLSFQNISKVDEASVSDLNSYWSSLLSYLSKISICRDHLIAMKKSKEAEAQSSDDGNKSKPSSAEQPA